MIYLDYNATTPIDPEVAKAILPFLTTQFGNPSSNHQFGRDARNAVENARAQVAAMLGCDVEEIVFTSGGTESNNLAIKGFAFANRSKGNHLITSVIEHPAVLEVYKFLKGNGFDITLVPVDEKGSVHLKEIEKAIRSDTILISIMHANNEIGTVQSIQTIVETAHSHNIALHTDAAQSIGKIKVNAEELGVDLLSIAGHKLYAPKGVGALYVRKGVELQKQTHGANHERNLRPGTENVLEIVGLGKACELVNRNLLSYASHFSKMRDLFENLILRSIPSARINGNLKSRLPNTSSISFVGKTADNILASLGNVAASAGAACHAEEITISNVISAIHVPNKYAKGTIRFSMGRVTTENEIREAAQSIIDVVSSSGD